MYIIKNASLYNPSRINGRNGPKGTDLPITLAMSQHREINPIKENLSPTEAPDVPPTEPTVTSRIYPITKTDLSTTTSTSLRSTYPGKLRRIEREKYLNLF